MRKVTFKAHCTDGITNIVSGWELRGGMVMHRSLFRGGQRDDHWTVSDPVTGARICCGWTPADALYSYRGLVASYGADYPAVLALARQGQLQRLKALAKGAP